MKRQPRHALRFATCAALVLVGLGSRVSAQGFPFDRIDATHAAHFGASHGKPHAVGLGKILTTADHGQIFGADINQNGNDGVLASAQIGGSSVSVETFDQNTGLITRSFAKAPINRGDYIVDGIFAGDVGLITHEVVQKSGFAYRHYEVMNPVSGEKFTNDWTPPVKDIAVQGGARVVGTATSVLFGIELLNQDVPDLIVSNIAANTFGKVFHLDPSLFGLGNGPRLGRYTAANQAVLATSPDYGARNGVAPINELVDVNTGKTTQFNGYNNGPFGAGYVNGLAVDPNTGIAATDTELNAQLEFYDVVKHLGITAVQLPCTGPSSQSNSGAGITADPLHGLFLVTNPFYCDESGRSALLVYDERGNLLETIKGFKFAIAQGPVIINPSKRMGWAGGPNFDQLQQFFY